MVNIKGQNKSEAKITSAKHHLLKSLWHFTKSMACQPSWQSKEWMGVFERKKWKYLHYFWFKEMLSSIYTRSRGSRVIYTEPCHVLGVAFGNILKFSKALVYIKDDNSNYLTVLNKT